MHDLLWLFVLSPQIDELLFVDTKVFQVINGFSIITREEGIKVLI